MPQPVVSMIQRLTYSPPNTQREFRPARAATSTSVTPKGEPVAIGALKDSCCSRASRAEARTGARIRPAPRMRLLRNDAWRKDLREYPEGEMVLPLFTSRNGLYHARRKRAVLQCNTCISSGG